MDRPNFRDALRRQVTMVVKDLTSSGIRELQEIAFDEKVFWLNGESDVRHTDKEILLFSSGFGKPYSMGLPVGGFPLFVCEYDFKTDSFPDDKPLNKKMNRPNFRDAVRRKINMIAPGLTPEVNEELQRIALEEGVNCRHVGSSSDQLHFSSCFGGPYIFGAAAGLFADYPHYEHLTDRFSIKYIGNTETSVAGTSEPEPLKFTDPFPDRVYHVTENAIKEQRPVEFVMRKCKDGVVQERVVFDYGGEHSFDSVYKTPEDAFRVFMKGRGK